MTCSDRIAGTHPDTLANLGPLKTLVKIAEPTPNPLMR